MTEETNPLLLDARGVTIEQGDVAHLCGSPEVEMTISSRSETADGRTWLVHAIWFDRDRKLHADRFYPETLRVVERAVGTKISL